jgi:hypothetical protein
MIRRVMLKTSLVPMKSNFLDHIKKGVKLLLMDNKKNLKIL